MRQWKFSLVLLAGPVASPALAWEFSQSALCTVTDSRSQTGVEMTFDGSTYVLTLTHRDGWPDAPLFAIQFAPNGPFIQTGRHIVRGQSLSVSDSGFGNVLNGLEFNARAIVQLGQISRIIDLTGAAGPVQDFRACTPAAPSV
jgi:hypothetical protein